MFEQSKLLHFIISAEPLMLLIFFKSPELGAPGVTPSVKRLVTLDLSTGLFFFF